MIIVRRDGKKGRIGSTCRSIFGFSNYLCFRSTEKVTEKYGDGDGDGYVRNTKILTAGTGTGTGSLPLRVQKYGQGADCFKGSTKNERVNMG